MYFAFAQENYKVSEDNHWKTYMLDGDQQFYNLDDAIAMVHNKEFGIWNRLVAANNIPGVEVDYDVLRPYGPHSAARYNLKKATFVVGTEADILMDEVMHICFTKFGLYNVEVCRSVANLYVIVDRKDIIAIDPGDTITIGFDDKGQYQSVSITCTTKGFFKKSKKITKVFTKVRG